MDSINADIFIIQECEDPERTPHKAYQEWVGDYLWVGTNKNKGIGIFVKNGYSIESLDWNPEQLELFLPCRINNHFNLIGVWTKQANSPTFEYIGQFWKYLQRFKMNMAQNKCLIIGDFNSNSIWNLWDRWWNHSDVVKELHDIEINSLYHQQHQEEQGKESLATLFMHRKIDRPYHIDYMFADKYFLSKVTNLNVGEPKVWLQHSDHMPLIASFNIHP
ncbi:MAG: hypothetical protein Q9M28_12050 [Mariprofundaceae bacterium]|nr:hypothetical protein [Mariprofundaceae bacterium]